MTVIIEDEEEAFTENIQNSLISLEGKKKKEDDQKGRKSRNKTIFIGGI